MKYYIFDLDDTLILHKNNINYNWISEDKELIYYLNQLENCYIYTNGNKNHALAILNKMNLLNLFNKIYSIDTIPYSKPYIKSFQIVNNDIIKYHNKIQENNDKFIFFDDQLINLKSASNIGWYTIWIHDNYYEKYKYNFINLSFRNIIEALKYLEKNDIK